MRREGGFDGGARPHERDANLEVPRSGNRAVNDVRRRVVPAHRINSYTNHF
jgi:hypothetical protein